MNITRCIQSLGDVADEVVVVDSNSTDRTATIAKSLGATVIIQNFLGYVEQKNFARERCSSDYVLSLDADEALSQQLQQEIAKLKATLSHPAYQFNRLTNLGDDWIKHSGWYPDKKTRLFQKDAGYWGGTNPHDKFIMNQDIKPLWIAGDLLHYSFPNKADYEKQSLHFAAIAAKAMLKEGKKSSRLKLFYKPLAAFFKCYVIKLGWVDVKHGWHIARVAAKAKYLKYKTLLELNSNS